MAAAAVVTVGGGCVSSAAGASARVEVGPAPRSNSPLPTGDAASATAMSAGES